MRFRTLLAAIVLVAMVYYIGFPPQPEWTGKVIAGVQEKAKDIPTPKLPTVGKAVASPGDIMVYFCAVDDCTHPLSQLINQTNQTNATIDCALYDVTIPGITAVLRSMVKQGRARLVVDDEATENDRALDFAKRDREGGLMHNKFCVTGSTVVMGSFNPTSAGASTFDNNLLIIRSPELAENYAAEFAELWDGTFGKGGPTPNPEIRIGSTKLHNAFCPEDWCGNDILRALAPAEKSIDFMLYSFTHDQIGDALVAKHNAGMKVRGVIEKSQNNAYDEYDKLEAAGIDVRWDGNRGLMHHKVLIIDGKTVVTGSFNPSTNADTRNDENILILDDPILAAQFQEEFDRVFALAAE